MLMSRQDLLGETGAHNEKGGESQRWRCLQSLCGSVSATGHCTDTGKCMSAMLPPLLQPPRAHYTEAGLHD